MKLTVGERIALLERDKANRLHTHPALYVSLTLMFVLVTAGFFYQGAHAIAIPRGGDGAGGADATKITLPTGCEANEAIVSTGTDGEVRCEDGLLIGASGSITIVNGGTALAFSNSNTSLKESGADELQLQGLLGLLFTNGTDFVEANVVATGINWSFDDDETPDVLYEESNDTGYSITTNNIDIISSETSGTITLSGGTGTATTFTGAICVCSDSTANNSVQCAVSGDTLTATGTTTDVIVYVCF